MSTPPLSDEILLAAIAARAEHGSINAAARALGMPENTFASRLKVAAKRGFVSRMPVMEGFEIKQTSVQLGPDGDLQREWVKQVPESGEPFELLPGHIVKGESAYVDETGRVRAKWIKTKTDNSLPDLVAALKSTFDEYRGYALPIPAPDATDASLLSVYPIADQHNGLLAWGRETGENYDLKIGVNRLRSCMGRLVAQSPSSSRAIILNLGDWQHTDDGSNMTPKSGNLLDVDSRYFKILTAGVKLMQDCIELALQKHERVLVRNIPGNHDPHASIALTVALSSFYSDNERVTIDDDPGDFFFHRFGSTLIGATHGHKMKADRMAMSMATLRREDWGATKYHWFLFGHIHHETVKEFGDVRCESFQTIAANDAYHHSNGFNSGKSLNSITLHHDDGEIGRHRVNVPPPVRSAVQ